jgi:nucleoid-associated protein YgaU
MGNFEKLVVLTVLFLLAIVGGVLLNDDGAEAAGPADPLTAAAVERGEAPAGTSETSGVESRARGTVVTPSVTPPETAPARDPLLLDSTIREESPDLSAHPGPPENQTDAEGIRESVEPTPERSPEAIVGRRRILVDETGLRPALVGGDFMIYTIRQGDSWAGLAQRFYRTTSYLQQLRSANEEMGAPVVGEEILVPVIDLSLDAGIRPALRPAPRAERPILEEAAREEDPPAPSASDLLVSDHYRVQPGDNLSSVSEKVYGTPHRWKEIFEANHDLLDSPDWVQVGMELRIPR